MNLITNFRNAHFKINYKEMLLHVRQLPSLAIRKKAIIADHDVEYRISRQYVKRNQKIFHCG